MTRLLAHISCVIVQGYLIYAQSNFVISSINQRPQKCMPCDIANAVAFYHELLYYKLCVRQSHWQNVIYPPFVYIKRDCWKTLIICNLAMYRRCSKLQKSVLKLVAVP